MFINIIFKKIHYLQVAEKKFIDDEKAQGVPCTTDDEGVLSNQYFL